MLDPDYVQPGSVEEAITALGRAPNDAIVVAGGIVVGSLFNQSLASPALLVDISRIESLRGIEVLATGELRLGALVTHEEVLRSTVLRRMTPLLPEMAAEISCPRLRNRGTLGGSLCTIGGQGDPATSLIALSARLALRGADGRRTVLLENFYNDPFAVDLRDGELVEAVLVGKCAEKAGFGFCKLAPRAAMDWTQITASVILTRSETGAIDDIRIGMNGVGATPNRPRSLEAFLSGRRGEVDWTAAAAVLDGEIDPAGDLVYSEAHKRRLAVVAVKRAVERALTRAENLEAS